MSCFSFGKLNLALSHGVTNAIATVLASVHKLYKMQPVEHGIGDGLSKGKFVHIPFISICKAFWLP